MSCPTCERFPSPTSKFKELGVSVARHGTIYLCKICEGFIEVIAEERAVRYLSRNDAEALYPDAIQK